MKGVKIATRYARSLVDLAMEQQSLERIYDDMRVVRDICKNRELIVFLSSPVIRSDKKQAIVKAVFGGRISDLTMRFLNIITGKRREMYIPDIAEAFMSQYKSIKRINTAQITTAVPLDDELRRQVKELVKSFTRSEVELSEKVDPSLIGGYILNMDDRQEDTSIKSKINKLKRVFKENIILNEN